MPGEQRVHRIARRAGHLADDHPFLTEQPVDERGFAGIGPADDRDRRLRVGGEIAVPAARGAADVVPFAGSASRNTGGVVRFVGTAVRIAVYILCRSGTTDRGPADAVDDGVEEI